MRFFLSITAILLIFQINVKAQDLLVIKGDSIAVKIISFDSDSSVHYKTYRSRTELYNGYLKKDYYTHVTYDYYSNKKRANNPDNGLGFFNLGTQFTYLPLNPIVDVVIVEKDILQELATGTFFSLSYQSFINPKSEYLYNKQLKTKFCFGFDLSYFKSKALFETNGSDLSRHILSTSLLISYHTQNNYTTYFTVKPTLMYNKYIGQYDELPLLSKSVVQSIGIGVDQKIINLSNKISLFLTADAYFLRIKSGRLGYKRISMETYVNYFEPQKDYGFSAGLALRYSH